MEDGKEGGGAPEAWERLRSEPKGDFDIFSVRSDHVRSPRSGEVHEFSVAESDEGVTVIALTPDGRMVLVEQFRHGVRRVELETPGGLVDPGEEPAAAAARELREETGYEGGEPELIGTLTLNPSWQDTRVHVAVIRGARRTGRQDQDPGEDVRVRTVPAAEVHRLVMEGRITASVSVCAVAMHRWHGSAAERGG